MVEFLSTWCRSSIPLLLLLYVLLTDHSWWWFWFSRLNNILFHSIYILHASASACIFLKKTSHEIFLSWSIQHQTKTSVVMNFSWKDNIRKLYSMQCFCFQEKNTTSIRKAWMISSPFFSPVGLIHSDWHFLHSYKLDWRNNFINLRWHLQFKVKRGITKFPCS